MVNVPISDLLAADKPTLSVEFFPPKDDAGGELILSSALEIADKVKPDFVSITYGAGGSTRERTFRYASKLKEENHFNVMPHLTCVGSSKAEIVEIVQGYLDAGFRNIMALRGDPPKGESAFKPHPDGLAYASDLVALLHSEFSDLCLGVGGYPETHPEAPSPTADLHNLKRKVEAGASFITTQLFYRTENLIQFANRCREIGIEVPIVPGLMPILSAKAAQRFCSDIPEPLLAALDKAGNDPEATKAVGVDWTYRQINELHEAGFKNIHLYIMNRSSVAIPLMSRLQAAGLYPPAS